MKIGILSSYGAVFLPPLIQAIRTLQVPFEFCVLLDGVMPERLRKISLERLDPSIEVPGWENLDAGLIPFYLMGDHNCSASIGLYKDLNIDYLVNGGTPRILKSEILSSTRGVLNAHPGILPKYRGCTGVEWSIYHDDPVGVTVHFMDHDIDTGPIVLSRSMMVRPGQNYQQIRTQMLFHQASVFAEAIKKVGEQNLLPNQLEKQSHGTYHKPIPQELMTQIHEKLARGEYSSS